MKWRISYDQVTDDLGAERKLNERRHGTVIGTSWMANFMGLQGEGHIVAVVLQDRKHGDDIETVNRPVFVPAHLADFGLVPEGES